MSLYNIRLLFIVVIAQTLSYSVLSLPTKQDPRSSLLDTLTKRVELKCSIDADCKELVLCKDNATNCYCNPNTALCDWKDRTIRPRWRRSISDNVLNLVQDDIGPDTCGKDRKVLSNWFLTHGSPTLLEDPIPENVLPTFPNPYEDPNKPPLQPDDIEGKLIIMFLLQ